MIHPPNEQLIVEFGKGWNGGFLMVEKEDLNGEELTEWTCSYCPSVATTIRQGLAVCYHHAEQLRVKTGLAKRILNQLRAGKYFPRKGLSSF